MWVSLGGHPYRDGELGMDEVLARMGEGFTTSGPAPGELVAAARAADKGDGAVILTISRHMSSVYQAARLAIEVLEIDGKKVAAVDTGSAAGAQGLVVLAASRAARAGLPLDEVVGTALAAARGTRLVATLPSLEHLARGGHVPGAAAWGARWLGLDPVFEFRQGRVRPLRPARGRSDAYRRIVASLAREVPSQTRRGAMLHVAALHCVDPGSAEELLDQVSSLVRPASAFVGSFSPVMAAHTGPGLAGLAWLWEDAVGGRPAR
jgi:DegV family protein with EDD domain